MAICDAKYNFVCVDVGQYGSNNDSGVLANSRMGIRFDQEKMKLPADEKIGGIDEPHKFPYFLLGDEILPLKHWLMRPYQESYQKKNVYIIIAIQEHDVLLKMLLGY